MTARAFITGDQRPGRQLPRRAAARRGRRGARPRRTPSERRPDAARASSSTAATSPTSTGYAACSVDVAPDEVYNLAALSSVARSWEEPDLTAARHGLAAVALLESARPRRRRAGRPVRFVQASSAEIFGEPGAHPAGRGDAAAPDQPVRRRQGLRPPHGRRLPPPRPARRQRDPLQPRVPRRPRAFVTRKITATVAAIARVGPTRSLGNLDARRDWGWAPDYVDAMVRAARADVPRLRDRHRGGPLGPRLRRRRLRPRRHRRLGAASSASTPPSCDRPDPTELAGDASLAEGALGWAPTVGFDEIVGRMVDADLARLEAEPARDA